MLVVSDILRTLGSDGSEFHARRRSRNKPTDRELRRSRAVCEAQPAGRAKKRYPICIPATEAARLPDGSRKIVAISEVLPLRNGEYQTRDLLVWRTDSISPEGKVVGNFVLKERPSFAEQAAIAQLRLPEYI